MTTPPSLKDAQLELDNGVAVLTLDRDDVRNALTGTGLLEDIIAVCQWIQRDDTVGALVITGNGKAFSAGGNIKDMQNKTAMFAGDPTQVQEKYRRGIQQLTLNLYRLETPVIAAINGAAVGAGLDMACMCDIRIGSEQAKAGETFINLGIIPGDGGAWFLPRVVGAQRAAEMTYSGRIVDAREALEIGLLMEVVPAADLLPRARELAAQFADKPRAALRMSKRLLRAGQRMELADFLDYAASLQSLCHTSDAHREALQRFLDK